MACGLRRCRGKRGCVCPTAPVGQAHTGVDVGSPTAEEHVEAVPDDVVSVFHFFDLDGNGKIDRSELAQVLQELDGTYWTLKRIRALFRAADVDRDQYISWKEFLDWIFLRGEEQHVLRTSVSEAAEARRQHLRSEHFTKLMAARSLAEFTAAKKNAEPFYSEDEMRTHEEQFRAQMRSKHEVSLVEVQALSAFEVAKKDAEQFFSADEMRRHEEQFNIRRRSALEVALVEAQSLSEYSSAERAPDVDHFFTADELRDYKERVKQPMRFKLKKQLEAAKAANLASSLKEALRDARPCFESQDLQQYEEQLEKLRLPFSVTVTTLAGSICTVDVERESSVKFLCRQVAKQFGIDLQFQEILLVHSGGRLEPPNRTLEACGVTSADVQLAAQLSLTFAGRERERKELEEQRADEERKKNAEERRTALHNNHFGYFKALALDELLDQAKKHGLLKEAETIHGHEVTLLIKHLAITHAIQDCKAEVNLLESKCSDLEAQIKQFGETCEQIEKVEIPSVVDKAWHVLAPAMAALDNLYKSDIPEVKAFKAPPWALKQTFAAMCQLLMIKPAKIQDEYGRMAADYWRPAIAAISRPNFIIKLQEWYRENLHEKVFQQVSLFIANEACTPEKVAKINRFGAAVCMWVHAMYEYHSLTAPETKLLRENVDSNLQLMKAAREELGPHQVRCQHTREDIPYFMKLLQAQAPLSKA